VVVSHAIENLVEVRDCRTKNDCISTVPLDIVAPASQNTCILSDQVRLLNLIITRTVSGISGSRPPLLATGAISLYLPLSLVPDRSGCFAARTTRLFSRSPPISLPLPKILSTKLLNRFSGL
jgi:hypothetical protein